MEYFQSQQLSVFYLLNGRERDRQIANTQNTHIKQIHIQESEPHEAIISANTNGTALKLRNRYSQNLQSVKTV